MSKVVLISKDQKFNHVVEKFLSWKGYEVLQYDNGYEVEDWRLFEDSAAIISDFHTDHLDGFSFLTALKEREIKSKLIMVANSLEVGKKCPFFYQILDGFFTKSTFTKMIPKILKPVDLNISLNA